MTKILYRDRRAFNFSDSVTKINDITVMLMTFDVMIAIFLRDILNMQSTRKRLRVQRRGRYVYP